MGSNLAKEYVIQCGKGKAVALPVVNKRYRRRYLRLARNKEGCYAEASSDITESEFLTFVNKHKRWLASNALRQSESKISTLQSIYFNGKQIPVVIDEGRRNACIKDDSVIVIVKDVSKCSVTKIFEMLAEKENYKFCAWQEEYRAKYLIFGEKPKIIYRARKSAWGVYNKKYNRITINVYLLQVEEREQRMVLFHEMCHQLVFGHDKNFYELLSREFPDYRELRKNLKKYGVKE